MDIDIQGHEAVSAPAKATRSAPVSPSTSAKASAPAAVPQSTIPVDKISALYRGEMFTEEAARTARGRIHWICAQCEGNSVLDVGCGPGIASVLLAREGFTVTAIDSHPDAVAYARDEVARETALVRGRIALLETDLASLPVQTQYDTIVLGEVIEHQVRPERLLRAAKARLKSGGRLVVTTPFALHPDPDHKVSLFPSHLVAYAAQLGLDIVTLEVDGAYMRCVLAGTGAIASAIDAESLLRMTENATLRSQEELFGRLGERADQLRRQTEATKVAQRKLAEAMSANEVVAREHVIAQRSFEARHHQEVEALRVSALQETKRHQNELESLHTSLAQAAEQHQKDMVVLHAKVGQEVKRLSENAAAALREKHQAALAVASTKLELQRREAATEAARRARSEHEARSGLLRTEGMLASSRQEIARLKQYNERMKERIAALRAAGQEIKATSSYRLGRTLVHGMKTPRGVVRLPSELITLWRSIRAQRRGSAVGDLMDQATDDNGTPVTERGAAKVPPLASQKVARPAVGASNASPPQPAPVPIALQTEVLANLLAVGGVDAVNAHLQGLRAQFDAKQLATACLELGRTITKSAGREVDFALAEVAVGFDRSESVLRGYFWASQRCLQIEAAYRTYRELKGLYSAQPNPRNAVKLEKLLRSPSVQLEAFELVLDRPIATVDHVPRRVCYVLHNSLPYSSGGYATRAHGVCGGLIAAGHEVIVLTRPGFPLDTKPELTAADVAPEDLIDGVRFVRTLEPQRRPGMAVLPYMTAATEAIERHLSELRPSVVIAASNYRTALPALIAARRLGIPFVYEVRGFWEVTRISREPEYEDTPAYATQSFLEAKVAKMSDHVFTLTMPMLEELVDRGVPRDRIDLLPNSCDPQRFTPRERDPALAARLFIPDDVPVIGYIGTFVDYEGLEDLTLACAMLKARGLVFRLLLVGNENASGSDTGPITQEIRRIVDSEGLGDWLIMPGRVPHEEVEAYYSLIDIAPFPRKPLPVCEMVSPMKPLEALAMRKAVLVSSVRALTELINDDHTGVVFDKGDINSMVEQLARLIGDPQLRDRLGQAGRDWVVAERTWIRVGNTLSEHFARLAEVLSQPGDSTPHSPPAQAAPPPLPAEVEVAPSVGVALPAVVHSDSKPRWWSKIDPSFRDRCEYVDVAGWRVAADVASLREDYVQKFGEDAVARRIPLSNWSRADICERIVTPCDGLLDVGSGLGEFVNLAALRGRHGTVTSVDRKDFDLWMDSTGALQRVYRDIFKIDASCARESVTCFEVIEHLPPERVEEACRVLRSLARRRLYVSVPFLESLPLYKGHRSRFDHVNLSALFPDARFTVFGKGGEDEVRAWIMCEVQTSSGAAT